MSDDGAYMSREELEAAYFAPSTEPSPVQTPAAPRPRPKTTFPSPDLDMRREFEREVLEQQRARARAESEAREQRRAAASCQSDLSWAKRQVREEQRLGDLDAQNAAQANARSLDYAGQLGRAESEGFVKGFVCGAVVTGVILYFSSWWSKK